MSGRVCMWCGSALGAVPSACPRCGEWLVEARVSAHAPEPAQSPSPSQSSSPPSGMGWKGAVGLGCGAYFGLIISGMVAEMFGWSVWFTVATVIALALVAGSSLIPRKATTRTAGVMRILFAALALLTAAAVVVLECHDSRSRSFLIGAVSGLALVGLCDGIQSARRRRLSWRPAAVVFVVSALLVGLFAPSISTRWYRRIEARAWSAIVEIRDEASVKAYETSVPFAFHRRELRDMKVEIEAKKLLTAARNAVRRKEAGVLRDVIRKIDAEYAEDTRFAAALETARNGLTELFRQALARLKEAEGGDSRLRTAFRHILDDLDRRNEGTIWVEFSASSDIDPGVRSETRQYRGERVEIMQPGETISESATKAREKAFLDRMNTAFSGIFTNGLLVLTSLPSEERDGKIVFAVNASTSKSGRVFILSEQKESSFAAEREIAKLEGLEVAWQFVVLDRAGKNLYRDTTRSRPAESISLPANADPPSAYNAMLDSAYDDYAAEIIRRFGIEN